MSYRRRSILGPVSNNRSVLPARLLRGLFRSTCRPKSIRQLYAVAASRVNYALWWYRFQHRLVDFSMACANICEQDTAGDSTGRLGPFLPQRRQSFATRGANRLLNRRTRLSWVRPIWWSTYAHSRVRFEWAGPSLPPQQLRPRDHKEWI